MQVTIRKSKNFKEAYQIAKSLPEHFDEDGLRSIKKALTNDILFAALVDSEMVGFLTLRKGNKKVVEVSWMGVLSKYQRKEVGSKLINKAFNSLKGSFKIAYIKTLADTVEDEGYANTRSFWSKNGFTPLETIDPYPGWKEGNPCLIMVKPL